jgi:hypothetical protein
VSSFREVSQTLHPQRLLLDEVSAAIEFAAKRSLRQTHAFGTCVKDDQRDRGISRHTSMKRINHLGYHLPSGKMLFLAVFFIAVDLLRSLGKRFPSSASFSPAYGEE